MRIGIISDTHSRYGIVEQAVEQLKKEAVDCVLHCGDVEDADTVWLFEGLEMHFVLGNCDHDLLSLQQAIDGIGGRLYRPFGRLEKLTYRIAWIHGDDETLLRRLEHSGEYDYLFHGHTHVAAQRRTGNTLVVNPGALHRAKPKSFAILDLETTKLQSIYLEP